MALPVIGYKSLTRLAGASFTDPGTATGYDIDDLANLKAWKGWKSDDTVVLNIDIDAGAAVQADYIVFLNHNLNALTATVTVQSDDNAGYGSVRTLQAAYTPDSDQVDYKGFTAQVAERYWRIVLGHAAPPFSAAPYIGEIFLGLKTELPSYVTADFDPFFKGVEATSGRSEGGHYLGALLRGQQHRGDIDFGQGGAARTAFTASLNAMLDDHIYLRRPFVFVLDTADADFDRAFYLKLPDASNVGRKAVGGCWLNLTMVLPVEEALMEPAS